MTLYIYDKENNRYVPLTFQGLTIAMGDSRYSGKKHVHPEYFTESMIDAKITKAINDLKRELEINDVEYLEVTKEKTKYLVGEVLNIDDVTVIAHMLDGTVKNVTNYATNVDSIDMSYAGSKELIITYLNASYTIICQVENSELTSYAEISGCILNVNGVIKGTSGTTNKYIDVYEVEEGKTYSITTNSTVASSLFVCSDPMFITAKETPLANKKVFDADKYKEGYVAQYTIPDGMNYLYLYHSNTCDVTNENKFKVVLTPEDEIE